MQRSGKTEKIYSRLAKYCSDAKVRTILYGTGIDRTRTWKDVNNSYLKGAYDTFESAHTAFQDDPLYVKAYKIGLEHVHNIRLMELYELYYNKAKDDVQAFKAFMDFSDKFFNSDKGENELMSLLQGVDIDE